MHGKAPLRRHHFHAPIPAEPGLMLFRSRDTQVDATNEGAATFPETEQGVVTLVPLLSRRRILSIQSPRSAFPPRSERTGLRAGLQGRPFSRAAGSAHIASSTSPTHSPPQSAWPQRQINSVRPACPSQWALQYLDLSVGMQVQVGLSHFLGLSIILPSDLPGSPAQRAACSCKTRSRPKHSTKMAASAPLLQAPVAGTRTLRHPPHPLISLLSFNPARWYTQRCD